MASRPDPAPRHDGSLADRAVRRAQQLARSLPMTYGGVGTQLLMQALEDEECESLAAGVGEPVRFVIEPARPPHGPASRSLQHCLCRAFSSGQRARCCHVRTRWPPHRVGWRPTVRSAHCPRSPHHSASRAVRGAAAARREGRRAGGWQVRASDITDPTQQDLIICGVAAAPPLIDGRRRGRRTSLMWTLRHCTAGRFNRVGRRQSGPSGKCFSAAARAKVSNVITACARCSHPRTRLRACSAVRGWGVVCSRGAGGRARRVSRGSVQSAAALCRPAACLLVRDL